jgi:transcriptional regulator with XRE-family HTH domain
MPPHRSDDEIRELRERAAVPRAGGVGAKRIAQQLGISRHLTSELLRGVPVPASLMRLRAKDDLRDAAIALRRAGRTYNEIKDELGVSKGSLSLWLRELEFPTDEQREEVRSGTSPEWELLVPPDVDTARALRAEGWLLREIASQLGVAPKTAFDWCRGVPVPPRAVHGRTAEEARAMGRAYWDAELARRDVERQGVIGRHRDRVGEINERELELLAAVAYWCEGSKSKPWRRSEYLQFINSDPDLIRIFVTWLQRRGVGIDRLRLCVNIHESADVDAATAYWAGVVGCDVSVFAKPLIKRHNPRTVRKNVGQAYQGCLGIGVRQSRLLYQEIEGIWQGIVAGALGSIEHAAN